MFLLFGDGPRPLDELWTACGRGWGVGPGLLRSRAGQGVAEACEQKGNTVLIGVAGTSKYLDQDRVTRRLEAGSSHKKGERQQRNPAGKGAPCRRRTSNESVRRKLIAYEIYNRQTSCMLPIGGCPALALARRDDNS